jgi:hypothetical protein
METIVDFEKRDLFVERVDKLISSMQEWVKDTGLKARASTITIEETVLGEYSIKVIEFNDKEGKIVAKVIPVGAYVIAAEGRVDIKGYLRKESVVFLTQGVSGIFTKVAGEVIDSSQNYSGCHSVITSEGWYWLEDKGLRKAYLLDRKLFLELITRVSDYEFR